jgi:hypothetical protein
MALPMADLKVAGKVLMLGHLTAACWVKYLDAMMAAQWE